MVKWLVVSSAMKYFSSIFICIVVHHKTTYKKCIFSMVRYEVLEHLVFLERGGNEDERNKDCNYWDWCCR